jgi:hypothetical protein
MTARAFELLFLLAILVPPAVVALGAITLTLPARGSATGAAARRHAHAAA